MVHPEQMGSGADLLLQDLLDQQDLGLRLLAGTNVRRRIRGAHAIEVPMPSRWLKPDWLMLTTGIRFADPAATAVQQRELIRELAEARIAALCFGVGVVLDEVPKAILSEAGELDFPVVEIPAEVPFLQVGNFVNQSVLSDDVYTLRRAVGLQNYLIDSLNEDDPQQALVERIGQLLGGPVVLFDSSGTVLASTGATPTNLIWDQIRSRAARQQRFDIGRWHVATQPLVSAGNLRWLAVASRRATTLDDLGQSMLDSAERLLGALSRSRHTAALEERIRRAEVLDSLLDGVRPGAEERMWDRICSFRFTRRAPMRVLALAPAAEGGDEDAPGENPVALALERRAMELDLPLLFAQRGTGVLGLVAARDKQIDAWLQDLPARWHGGLSEQFAEVLLAPIAQRDAGLALDAAERGLGAGHRITRFEELDMIDWLLASRRPDQIAAKAEQQLAALAGHPMLVKTLVAFLRSDLDVLRTARELHLHPNSVRYRLNKAEKLLGRPLTAPPTVASLYLALHDRLR